MSSKAATPVPYNVSVAVHWLTHSAAAMLDLCRPRPARGHRPPGTVVQSSGRSPVYNPHCTV